MPSRSTATFWSSSSRGHSTKILLVRHGRVAWNERSARAGWTDVPLDEQGEKEAALLRERFHSVPLTAVYSSDLARASRTAEIIAEPHDLPVQVEHAIREINYGDWEGLEIPEIEQKYGADTIASWQSDPENFRIPGGETFGELRDRAVPALAKIASTHPGETVLVVGHKSLNRVLICHWLGLSIGSYTNIEQKNAAVNSVVFDGNRVVVETVNDLCHTLARSPDLT